MPKPSPEARGRYEVRDHPTLKDLVVIWWLPASGAPSPTNITLGPSAVPLLAAALADWELTHAVPPPRPAPRPGQLRAVQDDGTV
jgi:hypothetical protein